jgi:uncharacterized protein YcbK (DUF882 family)
MTSDIPLVTTLPANSAIIRLTPHFLLSEFLHDNTEIPPPWILENLYQLANRLQAVRDMLNRPIVITSGYRSPQHNQQVGGVSHSLHLSGLAADIVIPGLPAPEVQDILKHWSGGLGIYPTHTHLDIRPTPTRWQG